MDGKLTGNKREIAGQLIRKGTGNKLEMDGREITGKFMGNGEETIRKCTGHGWDVDGIWTGMDGKRTGNTYKYAGNRPEMNGKFTGNGREIARN